MKITMGIRILSMDQTNPFYKDNSCGCNVMFLTSFTNSLKIEYFFCEVLLILMDIILSNLQIVATSLDGDVDLSDLLPFMEYLIKYDKKIISQLAKDSQIHLLKFVGVSYISYMLLTDGFSYSKCKRIRTYTSKYKIHGFLMKLYIATKMNPRDKSWCKVENCDCEEMLNYNSH